MTTLVAALSGVTALCFDTAPFIYFVERNLTYLDLLREVVRHVDRGDIAGYSSVVTLVEVLTQPKQVGNVSLQKDYRDLLLHSRNFTLVPLDVTIAENAADLRARYHLRTPDAIQIATALAAGCQAFLTNDRMLTRVAGLRVLLLDDLTL